MKLLLLFIVFLSLLSCKEKSNSSNTLTEASSANKDTVIVMHKNELNKFYEVGFLSKSYSYLWVTDRDTLDFKITATENKKDSSLRLNIFHRKTIMFTTALDKLDKCLKLIANDFNISKLSSLYFKEIIYYPDLSKSLSEQYEKENGQVGISYSKLNEFLLNSDLTPQINTSLSPLNKTVKSYSIEKFHLVKKENYQFHHPEIDLSGYPDFLLNGMGLYVELK